MSQNFMISTIDPAVTSPFEAWPEVLAALSALHSRFSGTGRPTGDACVAGMQWLDVDFAANTWAVYTVVDPAVPALDVLEHTIDVTTGVISLAVIGGLTFPDNSGGNASRYVMSTTVATAAYYAKLTTLAFTAANDITGNITLLITPKAGAAAYAPVLLTVSALQGAAGLSASSKINVLSSDETAIALTGLFLVSAASTNGTDVELWVRSKVAAAYDVQVLAASFDAGVSILAYNHNAAWQAAAPTGAVLVTSTGVSTASGWERIEEWIPTAVSAKDFTWNESLYSEIKLVIEGVQPTSGSELRMLLGSADGTNIWSSANSYNWDRRIITNIATTGSNVGAGYYLPLSYGGANVSSTTGEGFSGEVSIAGVGSTVSQPVYDFKTVHEDTGNNQHAGSGYGRITSSSAAAAMVDTARLTWGGGTFAPGVGRVFIYGLKRA